MLGVGSAPCKQQMLEHHILVCIYVEHLFCIHSQWGCGVMEDEVERCRVQAFLPVAIQGSCFPGFANDLNSTTMFLLAASGQGLPQYQRGASGWSGHWLAREFSV